MNDLKKGLKYVVRTAGWQTVIADELDVALSIVAYRMRHDANNTNADMIGWDAGGGAASSVTPMHCYAAKNPVELFEESLPSTAGLGATSASTFRSELVGRVDATPAAPLRTEDADWPEPTS